MSDKEGFVVGDSPEIARDLQKGRDFISVWSSPEKFYRHIKAINANPKNRWHEAGWEKEDSRGKDDYGRFYGSKDMDAAVKLAEDGWKEGAEKIERLRGYILAMNPKSPTIPKYGITGSSPSVPRAVAGNIMNMKQLEQGKSRKKPTITIMYDMAQNCWVSPEVLTNKAATVAALVDVIESQGFCCEVMATSTSKSGKFEAATTVMVKPSHQPVDTIRLGFALGHASMFRRFVFADWGGQKEAQPLGWGLGSTSGADKKDKELYAEKYIYTIPKDTDGFKTEELCAKDGVNRIIRDLQKQKCPPFMNWKDPGELSKEELAALGNQPRPDFDDFEDDDD